MDTNDDRSRPRGSKRKATNDGCEHSPKKSRRGWVLGVWSENDPENQVLFVGTLDPTRYVADCNQQWREFKAGRAPHQPVFDWMDKGQVHATPVEEYRDLDKDEDVAMGDLSEIAKQWSDVCVDVNIPATGDDRQKIGDAPGSSHHKTGCLERKASRKRGRVKGERKGTSQTARELSPEEIGLILMGLLHLPESALDPDVRMRNFNQGLLMACSPCWPATACLLELEQLYNVADKTLKHEVTLLACQRTGAGLNNRKVHKARRSKESDSRVPAPTPHGEPTERANRSSDVCWFIPEVCRPQLLRYIETQLGDGVRYLFPSASDRRYPLNPQALVRPFKAVAKRVLGEDQSRHVSLASLHRSVKQALHKHFTSIGCNAVTSKVNYCMTRTRAMETSVNKPTAAQVKVAWLNSTFVVWPSDETTADFVRQSSTTIRESKSESMCREIVERLLGVPCPRSRPFWLQGLELDGYSAHRRFGFEYQGEQHAKEIGYFHRSSDAFRKQQERDDRKRELCAARGVKLLVIPHDYSHRTPETLESFVREWLRENAF